MTKYLICNLKANKQLKEMIDYEKSLRNIVSIANLTIVICPSAPFLYLFQNEKYSLGSQDISEYENGSYTGEITGSQLSSMNVKYTLIGHSERRSIIKENQLTLANKIKRAYHSHINPIYFVGETKEEKANNKTKQVLEENLIKIFDEIPEYKRAKIIIVYEPIWSIGTGITPPSIEIKNIITYIKRIIKDKYNLDNPILYGGSVNKENITALINIKEIDGFVLGESCKNYENLQEIIKLLKN